MLEKTKGIVLHTFKHGETSVISHIYTTLNGKQSYIFKGLLSKKNKQRNALQPLSLLELIVYNKPSRTIQLVKEFKFSPVYQSIPFDVHKSTIALFLSEVLYRVLKEETPNVEMYQFIEQSLLFFDKQIKQSSLFHLLFLTQLSRYLGFFPQQNYSNYKQFFNLNTGLFSSTKNPDYGLNKKMSKDLMTLLSTKISELSNLKIFSSKISLLDSIMQFYRFHIDGINTINSLAVLKNVYAQKG